MYKQNLECRPKERLMKSWWFIDPSEHVYVC